LCVILPFMILAWGTAYKLSLYTTAKREAPAKVSTRGSDAAKSSVSHAIDGHKVVGNGIVPSLPVNSSRVSPEFRDAASLRAKSGSKTPSHQSSLRFIVADQSAGP
jgi:hypothetical protein